MGEPVTLLVTPGVTWADVKANALHRSGNVGRTDPKLWDLRSREQVSGQVLDPAAPAVPGTYFLSPGVGKLRGFARNPEAAKAAGRKGGLAGKPEDRYFAKNPELAKTIAKKGGTSTPPEKRAFYKDRDLASRMGKRGQAVAAEKRRAAKDV